MSTQSTNGTYPGAAPFAASTIPSTAWIPTTPHMFGPQGGASTNPGGWGFHPFAHPAFFPTPAFFNPAWHHAFNQQPAAFNPWGFNAAPVSGWNTWGAWPGPSLWAWNTPAFPPAFGWNTPFASGGAPAPAYPAPGNNVWWNTTPPSWTLPSVWNSTPWWNPPVGVRSTPPIPGYGAERAVGPCCGGARQAA